jgi:hypothetical protein
MKVIFNILLFLFGSTAFTQEVVDVSISSCHNETAADHIKNRLIEKGMSGDTAIISIGLIQNCDVLPEFHLRLDQDTLFLTIENKSNIRAACECCFEFTIKASGIKDTNFILVYNYPKIVISENGFSEEVESQILNIHENKYIFPTLNEINENSKSNQLNSDSLRVGIWDTYFDSTAIIRNKAYYFVDSNGQNRLKWIVYYDEQGEMVKVGGSFLIDGKLALTTIRAGEYLALMKKESEEQ